MIALYSNYYYLPQRDNISINKRPFSVQVGVQAIAKNNLNTLTKVSSLNEELVWTEMLEVVRNSCAGNQSESFSGSKPI